MIDKQTFSREHFDFLKNRRNVNPPIVEIVIGVFSETSSKKSHRIFRYSNGFRITIV